MSTTKLTDWRGECATNATNRKLKRAMPELDAPAPVRCSAGTRDCWSYAEAPFPFKRNGDLLSEF